MSYNTTVGCMKLIVFDWDQTLWNSWDVHVAAAQYAAGVMELPVPSEEWIASTFSVPFARHLKLIFADSTQQATGHYLEYYHSRVKELASLFEGVPETLEALKENGYEVALLSDKRRVYGSQELEFSGIAGLFDHVLFLDDGRAYKPDPQGLLQVMSAVSATKEEVLFIGDSHVDVQCARRTGVASAAALWGSVNVQAVLKESPDLVLREVREVLSAVES